MSGLRRLLPLLLATLLALSPAAALAQGGAGDDQYRDPFAGSGESGSGAGGASDAPRVTDEPPAPLGSGSADAGSSASGSTQAAANPQQGTAGPTGSASGSSSEAFPSARQELPRTGLDAAVIACLGIGLLAAGIGLRLRTVDGSAT